MPGPVEAVRDSEALLNSPSTLPQTGRGPRIDLQQQENEGDRGAEIAGKYCCGLQHIAYH